METFLTALLQCSLSMSVITFLYAIVLPILSKRYAPKWRYMVWLLIAAAWLIPFRPLIELPFLSAQSTNTPLMPVQIAPASPITNITAEALTPAPEMQTGIPQLSMWEIGFFLWLAGVVFMLVYHIWRHSRFMKMVNRWSEVETAPEILQLLDTLKQEQRIKSQIEYKICSSISSPMMVGFFRPVILMPSIKLSENELILILRHELTHFKRHDLWYKTIVLAATVLHWFNPVVYFMARATSVQCEIACDALVLENENMQMRKQYGETIIAVVRGGKAHQTALSTNFYGGKRGMKNRIASMLDSKRKKAGVTILCIVLAGIMLTGATLVADGNPSTSIPNTAFTDEEYGKLLALRFDGYEDMSVAEFQKKVWEARDTAEYMALLERFSQDEALYAMKDSNEIASFLFHVLEPLTSEKWQSREFGGYASTNYEASDNAMLEYQLTMKILDANTLTVRQYNDARLGVVNAIPMLLQKMPLKELKTDQKDMLQAEIDQIARTGSSDSLQLSIQFDFRPLSGDASDLPANDTADTVTDEQEPRRNEYGTAKDYASLLVLMTPNYSQMTVSDFNAALLDWGNEDFDRAERISEDAGRNDYQVELSAEERSFVTLTRTLSGEENFRMIQSLNTGKPEQDPWHGGINLYKDTGDGTSLAWCNLWYQFSYHIADKEKLTVGERDRSIGGMINAIQAFWDETPLDDLLRLTESDVVEKMVSLSEEYSSDLITIMIDENQVQFEGMNERNLNYD